MRIQYPRIGVFVTLYLLNRWADFDRTSLGAYLRLLTSGTVLESHMYIFRALFAIFLLPVSGLAGDAGIEIDAPGETVETHFIDLHDPGNELDLVPRETLADEDVQFVLIHGFRTPVEAGRRLATQLGASIHSTMAPDRHDRLYAVLWNSGGHASMDFAGAADRADIVSEPVAKLISKIDQATGKAPIVVIAHSLGARVALGALGQLPTGIHIDVLMLVQPAIPAASIYDWRGSDTYNRLYPGRIAWDTPTTPCQFATAIDRAARVIVTTSVRDTDLSIWFRLGRELIAEGCWPLRSAPALGLPYSAEDHSDVYPGYPRFWEDRNRLTNRKILGLEPADPPGSQRSLRDTPALAAIVDYTFEISHPSVEFVSLEELLDAPPADWHSPFEGSHGEALIQAARNRISAPSSYRSYR